MRMNTSNIGTVPWFTYEGGRAKNISLEQELSRTVCSCFLWEDSFYESGVSISERIMKLVPKCDPRFVADLAVAARKEYNLRHVPLLLCVALAKIGRLSDSTLATVICRADELAEFLKLYFAINGGKCPISAQAKKGLAMAFGKFDEYQLAKYFRKTEIKLSDVMKLVHPVPKDLEQAALWNKLINNELATPDTWEVALSKGEDKKETFERLIESGKLGYMALLANLRNMAESGVDRSLVRKALLNGAGKAKALPFRYISAARAVPQWEDIIEQAMLDSFNGIDKILEKTVFLIDVSGSMEDDLSSKSTVSRLDAAASLAIIGREVFEDVDIYTFSDRVVQIAPRRGFALRDAIVNSQDHRGTYLARAISAIRKNRGKACRMIIITDEQSHDGFSNPSDFVSNTYLINIAPYRRGVGYGHGIVHIDGFSESVVRYIQFFEDGFMR